MAAVAAAETSASDAATAVECRDSHSPHEAEAVLEAALPLLPVVLGADMVLAPTDLRRRQFSCRDARGDGVLHSFLHKPPIAASAQRKRIHAIGGNKISVLHQKNPEPTKRHESAECMISDLDREREKVRDAHRH